MSELRFEDVAAELEWDGALRDLVLLETTAAEWHAVFATVVGGPWPAQLKLGNDEVEAAGEKDVRDLIDREESALLSVDVAGAIFNCHFFEEERIEFDVGPTEVTAENFSGVLEFIRTVGQAARRNAFFAHEGGPPGSIFGYRLETDSFEALSRPADRTDFGEQLQTRIALFVACHLQSWQDTAAAAQRLRGEAGAAWEALYHPDQWNWHTDLAISEYRALSEMGNGVLWALAVWPEDASQPDPTRSRRAGEEFWKSLAALAKAFDLEPEAQ